MSAEPIFLDAPRENGSGIVWDDVWVSGLDAALGPVEARGRAQQVVIGQRLDLPSKGHAHEALRGSDAAKGARGDAQSVEHAYVDRQRRLSAAAQAPARQHLRERGRRRSYCVRGTLERARPCVSHSGRTRVVVVGGRA